jgi:hypothetical protein
MAVWASVAFGISTQPKPRGRALGDALGACDAPRGRTKLRSLVFHRRKGAMTTNNPPALFPLWCCALLPTSWRSIALCPHMTACWCTVCTMRRTRGMGTAPTSREGPPRPSWGGARGPQALHLPLPARRLDRQRLAMQARALQSLHGCLRCRGIGHLDQALGLAGGLRR